MKFVAIQSCLGFLVLLSIFIIYRISASWSKDPGVRYEHPEKGVQYYIDIAFPLGIVYVFLCAIFFAFDFYQIQALGCEDFFRLVAEQNEFFYTMAGISFGHAILITKRSKYLDKYRALFILLGILWTLFALMITPILIQ